MHYNIDGTVAFWDRQKPLIFGEHGPYHYISPQAAAAFGGPAAYPSFDRALEACGLSERLFIEYARREEVTGVTPFNFIHYSTWPMPDEDLLLHWDDPSAPGPKPHRIPAHTLAADNGLLPDGYPLAWPNPAAAGLEAAFKPVTVIPDQLDTVFYGGQSVRRSFSIYNDTERQAQVTLSYRLRASDGHLLAYGRARFPQAPGERRAWEQTFYFSEVVERQRVSLHLDLAHGEEPAGHVELAYSIAPRNWKTGPFDAGFPRHVRMAYVGDDRGYEVLTGLEPGLNRLESLTSQSVEKVNFLIIGPGFSALQAWIQPILEAFVAGGGFLLVMEQQRFTLGDLSLSGRGFCLAWPSQPDHPVLKGLTAEDLRFWGPDNPHTTAPSGLVVNGFNRPVKGDYEVLLECGAGDFGWGGLLWTPLLLYHIGAGQAVFCQVELIRWFETAPAAACLLRNLLEYGIAACQAQGRSEDPPETCLLVDPGSPPEEFVKATGLIFQRVRSLSRLPESGLVVVDPAALDPASAVELHAWVARGGQAAVLPAGPEQESILEILAGREVGLVEAPVYQLAAVPGPLTRGLAPYDLDWIEKVTYTPPAFANTVIGQCALEIERAAPVLQSLDNPWEDFFVRGQDAEYVKMAVAARHRGLATIPYTYAATLALGEGRLAFIQVGMLPQNDKALRLYTRFLGNLGASFETPLLRTFKTAADDGLDAVMALAAEPYQDRVAMLAYFTATNFTLNNLGEGVYGWMKRFDRAGGALTIPASAGGTWFLTAFIESEVSDDPSLPAAGEEPAPAFGPDLFLEINCPFDLYINGGCVARSETAPEGTLKIEDVPLRKGAGPESNRFVLACQAGGEDIRTKAWFTTRSGEPLSGVKYRLTLD